MLGIKTFLEEIVLRRRALEEDQQVISGIHDAAKPVAKRCRIIEGCEDHLHVGGFRDALDNVMVAYSLFQAHAAHSSTEVRSDGAVFVTTVTTANKMGTHPEIPCYYGFPDKNGPAGAPPSNAPGPGRRIGAAAMKKTTLLALLLAILLLGISEPSQAQTATEDSPDLSKTPGWSVRCGYLRSAPIDPIVYPRTYGVAHEHDLFGGRVRPDSTLAQLRRRDTTCRFSDGRLTDDKSGYWAPSLYRGGTKIRPISSAHYYLKPPGVDGPVEAHTPGLKMVAGEAHGEGLDTRHVWWGCGGGGDQRRYSEPVDCNTKANPYVKLVVEFPSCGRHAVADSPDHKSHMAYPDPQTGCPETHPKPMPSLVSFYRFNTSDGDGLRLSSGATATVHADYFEAWGRRQVNALLNGCLNRGVRCP